MPKTSDMDITKDFLRVQLVGPPGCGKSCGWASWPGDTYCFDTDQRMRSIATRYPDRKNIEYDTYFSDDYMKLEAKFNLLEMNCKYRNVSIASLTTLADLIMLYSLDLRGKGGSRDGKMKGIIKLFEIEDFGVEASGLTQLLDKFRQIKANTFLETHDLVTIAEDIVEKKTIVHHSVITAGKKIAAKVPAFFDEVWRIVQEPNPSIGKGPVRKVFTQETGHGYAKTSLPLPVMMDITDKNLYDVIKLNLEMKGLRLEALS